MVLLDTIQAMANERSDRRADKHGHARLMSKKIKRLRALRHLTQREVAERMGVSETAVRNYELMRAYPKDEHIDKMAKAFDVRPECLHLYDFKVSHILASAVFQLGEIYGLRPHGDERFACLLPTSGFMERFLGDWAYQYAGLRKGLITREAYELWKDGYAVEYSPSDAPGRFDGATGELIEPWEAHCFGGALKRHRGDAGMTQSAFAESIGVKEGVYRSYEQGRRLPKLSVIKGFALLLGVTEGSLTFFDFGTPLQAAHALFQLASGKWLVPDEIDGQLMLRTVGRPVELILDQWAGALQGVYEGTGWERVDSYQAWKDKYLDSVAGFGGEWRSRYRPHRVGGGETSLSGDGWESDFDPYDDRYERGHLRA